MAIEKEIINHLLYPKCEAGFTRFERSEPTDGEPAVVSPFYECVPCGIWGNTVAIGGNIVEAEDNARDGFIEFIRERCPKWQILVLRGLSEGTMPDSFLTDL